MAHHGVGGAATARARRRLAVTIAALVAVAGGCVAPSPTPPVDDPGTSTGLTRLSVVAGPDAAIVDGHGRTVQLRGANLNHLGDYFAADPRLPTVSPLGDDDWDDLAAAGFNVVRLVTSWSSWQPERDRFDTAYLARVRTAIEAANDRGMYVVVDLHQDAWSRFVHTPRGEECPAGTRPHAGWDGAPAWATFTDGQPTCGPGRREESPAVIAAWDAFYANREGIRDELAALWGRIAAELAGNPGLAGYDLLNEPGHGSDLGATLQGLTDFYHDAIDRIRAAEAAAGADAHLVMFEPTVNGVPTAGPGDDPNLVWAPHMYAESIGPSFPGFLDLLMAGFRLLGDLYDTPVWIGEYGSFSDDAADRRWMERFAELHEANGFSGGAWWQWEQECGDPHETAGAWPTTEEWVLGRLPGCDGSRMAVACPSRSFPRAAPGRVTSVTAEPCGGGLTVVGTTPAPSTADLWYQPAPGADPQVPEVTGTGVVDVRAERSGPGWRIFVAVEGDYRIDVGRV